MKLGKNKGTLHESQEKLVVSRNLQRYWKPHFFHNN